MGIIPYAVGRMYGYTLESYAEKGNPSVPVEMGLDNTIPTDPSNYVRSFSGQVLMNQGEDGLRGMDPPAYADNIGFGRSDGQICDIYRYDASGSVIRDYQLTYDDQGRLLTWTSEQEKLKFEAVYAGSSSSYGPAKIKITSGDSTQEMDVVYNDSGCISEIRNTSESGSGLYRDLIYTYRESSAYDMPLFF